MNGFNDGVSIRFLPNERGNPPGKLADGELYFTAGILAGLKLIGFAIWERRGAPGGQSVTFPARSYAVNGERRSFALLRPTVDGAQNVLRDVILDAWREFEARAADTAPAPVASSPAPSAADRIAGEVAADRVFKGSDGFAGRSLDESVFGEF